MSEQNKFDFSGLKNKFLHLKKQIIERLKSWKTCISREQVHILWTKIKQYPYKTKIGELYKKIRKFRLKRIISYGKKYGKKATGWISSSWKIALMTVSSFLFFYYALGSCLVENLDITTIRELPKQNTQQLETANTMAFLINREIDEKMWTPNLPIIFPAYILDNMPNFQVGIIKAVRDAARGVKKISSNNPDQFYDAKEAYENLRYSPYIWLLSKVSTFNIAPSSNTQYRKARKALRQYNKDGSFTATAPDLEYFLAQMGHSLRKLAQKNEEQIIEHSADWFDNEADNRFYHNRGYAFAAWQIAAALGVDYKDVLVQKDVYTEWTHLISSLQKAAEFAPLIVRNAEPDSLSAPNHLIVQSYYLIRAHGAAENIRVSLVKDENAD